MDDYLVAMDPLLYATDMLNRVFPGMLGINFIGYAFQQVEDVLSGMTDLDSAANRFAQTLREHGVVRGQGGGAAVTSAVFSGGPQRNGAKKQKIFQENGAAASSRAAVLEKARAQLKSIDIKPRSSKIHSPESLPTDFGSKKVDVLQESGMADETCLEAAAAGKDNETAPGTATDDVVAPPPEQELDDEIIERRIADLAEAEAIPCPRCRQGKIHFNRTKSGKSYCHCTHKACKFISWGERYDSACPECGNPFLLSATGAGGSQVINCITPACRYPNKPQAAEGSSPEKKVAQSASAGTKGGSPAKSKKKKVVRRRLVRVKR